MKEAGETEKVRKHKDPTPIKHKIIAKRKEKAQVSQNGKAKAKAKREVEIKEKYV